MLFPIMHTFVIKDSVLKENPWVAASTNQNPVRPEHLSNV